MDWFERLTGFCETTYDETRGRLAIEDGMLVSTATGARHGIGQLELVSLDDLRTRVGEPPATGGGRLRVRLLSGDVRAMHVAPEHAGALFQVASQFNLLEMASPRLTPEDGVTIYQSDPTQGPACAIAAGAATIFRNYFAPTSEGIGQTRSSQLDGLADLGQALSEALHQPIASLWTMRNGYAMCSRDGLEKLTQHLGSIDDDALDALRGKLRIGVHSDVEVTDAPAAPRPQVSQVFCSALPVAYSDVPSRHWAAFASLVLEAAYEATLLAAELNARRGASNIVLLTRLGGGAFGNEEQWIQDALRRALSKARNFGIEVRLVSHRAPSREMQQLASEFE